MDKVNTLFTVVVPTCNRPRQLTGCLEALARLDYPQDRFEVIIIDDGGETPLDAVVDPFRERIDLILLRQANEGPASARNQGAAHARGRFLVFTDDDCAPAPNWLRALEARFMVVEDSVVIGGRVLNALSDNLYSSASQLIVDAGCAYHNADPERARFFTANNLGVATARFGSVGGFNSAFRISASEDREFCGRWLHRGYHIAYAPEVLVYHFHDLTGRSFWHQHFTYGRGAFRLQQIRMQQRWQLFKPDPRYYLDLLSRPMARPVSWRSLWLLALVVESQFASAIGMIAEWLRYNRDGETTPHGA